MFRRDLENLTFGHRRWCQPLPSVFASELPIDELIAAYLNDPPGAAAKWFRVLEPPSCHLLYPFQQAGGTGVRLGHNNSPVLRDHQRILSEASHFLIRSLLQTIRG